MSFFVFLQELSLLILNFIIFLVLDFLNLLISFLPLSFTQFIFQASTLFFVVVLIFFDFHLLLHLDQNLQNLLHI